VRDRQRVLRETMPRRGVELHYHDPEISFLEGALARGGREMAGVIERAWRSGGGFDAWTEHFNLQRWLDAFAEEGVDPVALASEPRDPAGPLPWDHIDSGVTRAYLRKERERAMSGVVTPDCSFEDCTACGVCPSLDVDVVLAGESRG
jgi:hypothetical protein